MGSVGRRGLVLTVVLVVAGGVGGRGVPVGGSRGWCGRLSWFEG